MDDGLIESVKLKRWSTSLRIRVDLLRGDGKWHVGVRRGILRDGFDDNGRRCSTYDYGGKDTYVASLSRQDMTEAEAKDHFAIVVNTLIRMASWEPSHLP